MSTTNGIPDFGGDLEARDRAFVEALLEGCSTAEAARRAGSKATTERGLQKQGSKWLKRREVQALLTQSKGSEKDKVANLAAFASDQLETIIGDENLRGTNAHVRACALVFQREERLERIRARSPHASRWDIESREEREAVVLEAAAAILSKKSAAQRKAFIARMAPPKPLRIDLDEGPAAEQGESK